MINPNKNYKSKMLATIVKLDPPEAYIPYVTIKTDDGRLIEGPLHRAHSQPERLKLNDRVGFEIQFSIVGDKFMIAKLIRKKGT